MNFCSLIGLNFLLNVFCSVGRCWLVWFWLSYWVILFELGMVVFKVINWILVLMVFMWEMIVFNVVLWIFLRIWILLMRNSLISCRSLWWFCYFCVIEFYFFGVVIMIEVLLMCCILVWEVFLVSLVYLSFMWLNFFF